MAATAKVLVLIGSVRAGRRGPAIAAWVAGIGREATGLAFELVDLADWPLPMDDEPGIPAHVAGFAQPHSRAWADTVAAAAAIVWVTPQYTWGYPAALKNAIDHLYSEWRGKPLAIVSYGGHGGGKAANQLRQVAEGLKMRGVASMPALTLTPDVIGGGAFDPAVALRVHEAEVRAALAELAAMLPAAPGPTDQS